MEPFPAEDVIWIFGSGRTGSSWLAFMLSSLPDHVRWNEPLVGYLFGHLYYERGKPRQATRHFLLGDEYSDVWLRSLRGLVLEGTAARFPKLAGRGLVVIKEPHGSIGAPLLSRALPESRMIFLVRDPRDVAASALAVSFIPHQSSRGGRRRRASETPESFIRGRSRTYRQDIDHVRQAYESHRGPKVFLRYEDLRADAVGGVRRIRDSLGLPATDGDVGRAVEEQAWENIPDEEKGPETLRRKATPGGWREDLTPEQARIVEKEAGEVLRRFYADG